MNDHTQEEAWGTERGRSPSGVPHEGEENQGEGTWHELKEDQETVGWVRLPRLSGGRGHRSLKKEKIRRTLSFTPAQRLLILDTWQRSGLPCKDFAGLVGVSVHTLYGWKKRFKKHGPEGLYHQNTKMGKTSSRLPEITKRAILMIKEANSEYGCRKISSLLERGPGLGASANAVARVLHEAGYQPDEQPTNRHPDQPRRFERGKANQLWQTDLFTFVMKHQNRRVYLVIYMDDHSRYIVGHGLHASQSGALVIEVLRASIASHGQPEELLTDNGSQYKTWRGKGDFTRECEKRGIRQIISSPRHPQTLGKVERFWGTLWREMLQQAIFVDMGEARERIGYFIDFYNFQRPHQGIEGLVPADRYYGAAEEVKQTLKARVKANSLTLALQGRPQAPFYLTGTVGGKPVSVRAQGDRLIVEGEGIGQEQEKTDCNHEETGYNTKEETHGAETETRTAPEPGDYTEPGRAAGGSERIREGAGSDRLGSIGREHAGGGSIETAEPPAPGLLQPGKPCDQGPDQSVRAERQGTWGEQGQEDQRAGAGGHTPGAGSEAIPEPDQSSAESDRSSAVSGKSGETCT